MSSVSHHNLTCYVTKSVEHPDFWEANIWGFDYGDIVCLSRDPVRAEGMAWEELGQRMIKRTRTLAYKSLHEGPDGYVP